MKTRKNNLRTIAIIGAVTLLGALANINQLQANTLLVTSTADDRSAGTLRAALDRAMDGDTTDATGISGTITLLPGPASDSQLGVTKSVRILGSGPANVQRMLTQLDEADPDSKSRTDGNAPAPLARTKSADENAASATELRPKVWITK